MTVPGPSSRFDPHGYILTVAGCNDAIRLTVADSHDRDAQHFMLDGDNALAVAHDLLERSSRTDPEVCAARERLRDLDRRVLATETD